jgi:hypothetical protein
VSETEDQRASRRRREGVAKAKKTRERKAAADKQLQKDQEWLATWPKVAETYEDPSRAMHRQGFSSVLLLHEQPSCVNADLRLRRYRITAELIEESIEVLRERLRKLWRETDRNTHYWDTMREAAVELGMSLNELRYEDQGCDHPRYKSGS